jgi:hypothetical protein
VAKGRLPVGRGVSSEAAEARPVRAGAATRSVAPTLTVSDLLTGARLPSALDPNSDRPWPRARLSVVDRGASRSSPLTEDPSWSCGEPGRAGSRIARIRVGAAAPKPRAASGLAAACEGINVLAKPPPTDTAARTTGVAATAAFAARYDPRRSTVIASRPIRIGAEGSAPRANPCWRVEVAFACSAV